MNKHNIMTSSQDGADAIVELDAKDFLQLLYQAPETAILLWTLAVREYLYNGEKKLEALVAEFNEGRTEASSATRQAEVRVVIASACRRIGKLEKAEEYLKQAEVFAAESGRQYPKMEIMKERGMIFVEGGEHSKAAYEFFRAASGYNEQVDRPRNAHARRLAALHAFYGLFLADAGESELFVGLAAIKEANTHLLSIQGEDNTHNTIQAICDKLFAEWCMANFSTNCFEEIIVLKDILQRDAAMRHAFGWSATILEAAVSILTEEVEELERMRIAVELLSKDENVPRQYREDAALAAIEILMEQNADGAALTRIVRLTKSGQGVAKRRAENLIKRVTDRMFPAK